MSYKNPTIAFVLAFIFGPLGLLYVSVSAFFVFAVVETLLMGFGMILSVPLVYIAHCFCAHYMAKEHNKKQGFNGEVATFDAPTRMRAPAKNKFLVDGDLDGDDL